MSMKSRVAMVMAAAFGLASCVQTATTTSPPSATASPQPSSSPTPVDASTAAWIAARQAAFTKWRTEHPGTDAQVSAVLSRTAALTAADASVPKYGDLVVRSKALRPDQAAWAMKLFNSAFTLWQQGDFSTAEFGLREGLEIFPANGAAHYYLGDILSRKNDRVGAAAEMDIAATLTPGTVEGLKARTALKTLPDPAVNAPPKIVKATDSPLELWDCAECSRMVVIPAGRFTMGSPDTEKDRFSNEGPRHVVTIDRPFALGRTAVTRGEFAVFVRETGYKTAGCSVIKNGSWTDDSSRSWRDPAFTQTDDHPAVCVSFDDAQAYVAWLNRKIGRPLYRLPSEAEMEYAARAGTTTARYWAEDETRQCEYANGADVSAKEAFPENTSMAKCRDGYAYTSPVGSFRPNPFGLYDMNGNATNWTGDCWNDYYNGAPANGTMITSGECGKRVTRGGSWMSLAKGLRSAYRGWSQSDTRHANDGFRLARILP